MKSHDWMAGKSLFTVGPGKSNKNSIYTKDIMNEKQLEKLTKSQLIKMLMNTQKPSQPKKPKNRINLEYLMDEDPLPGIPEQEDPMEKSMRELRRKDRALIRQSRRVDKKYRELVHPESRKPKIKKLDRALRNFKRSYDIEVMGNQNPLLQINQTRVGIFERLLKTLQSMKGFKLLEIMKVTFEKTSGRTTITKTAYFNSSNHVVLNEADLRDALKISNEQLMNKIGVWISEGSGWTITSVNKQYVNVAAYKPIEGSSYINLPAEIKNRNATINLQNDDNECFRWCHIRHLNPRTNNPQSAHQDCNLKLRINPDKLKIPVIFHNLRGYDSHFTMQEMGEIVKNHKQNSKEMNINVIPNNMEKYMAFMLGDHLTFIDSFQFMSSSLDRLVSNLPKEALKYTSKMFKGEKLDLMSKKGVYPYDYMDCFHKFDDTQLPSKEEFYSELNNEHISDDDYEHAKKVWKKFKLNTMGDYHDLYLTSDILLLTDVFENFRKTCLEYYKLDPCHYFTSPGLSWDAMLKMTDIKLELMTDIDMFQFIEKGLRGGISYIANRYGKANNKYMKNYDPKAPSKYIMYLDANNLYG